MRISTAWICSQALGRGAGSVLVYWDRLWWPALEGDQEAWASALVELEDLAGALLAALAAGRIRLFGIDDGFGHRFTLTRNGLRRFWRRGGGLAARIAPAPERQSQSRTPSGQYGPAPVSYQRSAKGRRSKLEGPGGPRLAGEEEARTRRHRRAGRKKLSGASGTMAREAGMLTMASMIT